MTFLCPYNSVLFQKRVQPPSLAEHLVLVKVFTDVSDKTGYVTTCTIAVPMMQSTKTSTTEKIGQEAVVGRGLKKQGNAYYLKICK